MAEYQGKSKQEAKRGPRPGIGMDVFSGGNYTTENIRSGGPLSTIRPPHLLQK